MKTFLSFFYIFFTYSVIGWIVESLYVSIKEKKIINRGFLIGPYCPIYGCGSLAMILYLNQYKNNIITVFFLAVVLCSILEYLTSYLMEKLFNARWWDYSKEKFNLNGRICGKNAILFGIGGVVLIYILHPTLEKISSIIPTKALNIITIIFLIIFITDTIFSLKIVNKLRQTITNLNPKKDSTQELKDQVKEVLFTNHKIFQKRLLNAFPDLTTSLNNFKNDIKELLKTK